MKDDKNKAKLITLGIAVLLIVIVCGISLVIHMMNKKGNEDSSSKLQSDIMEYASSTQEQTVTAEDITEKKEQEEKEQEEKEQAEKEASEPAVVVEKEEVKEEVTIIEETASEQKATAEWQKDAKEDLSTVKVDLPRQMSEMKGYWEAGNMEAVEDLAYLPRYRAASQQLAGTTKYFYYGDTDGSNRPHGVGLAMYTDNQYYYGEWEDGVRSGDGMWIKFYVYDQNAKAKDSIYLQHSYSGNWSGDLPGGEGAEHYDFIDENLEEGVEYNRNFIGNFKNGLYDGEIYITNWRSDGNIREWTGTAKNGVWQPMGEKDNKGQYPVIVEITNPDNYQWMPEKLNKNQGVDGLISAAK